MLTKNTAYFLSS